MIRSLLVMLALAAGGCMAAEPAALRVATFNASLNDSDGRLLQRLQDGDAKARKIAAVIQRVRPDLLLVNEFDYDAEGRAAELFVERYLGEGQFGEQAIHYPHRYLAAVNTGVPSGVDINGDGKVEGPADAWGFGFHPGQFGMLVLSRFPIDAQAARTFQQFRWSQMPGALRPMQPDSEQAFHQDPVWQQLRLSSKSHWDLPVQTPGGPLHFLVAHPTPPVFDGPENLNGRRNFDEIRLWAEYLSRPEAAWLVDDQGRSGGLPADRSFVLAGDLNADPHDGANVPGSIQQLLDHPRSARFAAPSSAGAAASGPTRARETPHRTAHAEDTAQFSDRAGNLRVDYVIPSADIKVKASGVFWPAAGEPGADWLDATDHHLVWLDLILPAASERDVTP